MLQVINRKKKLKEFFYDENTRKLCRLENQNTFIRDRKIPFTDLLFLTLNNKAKTTSMEIRDYEIKVKGKEKVNYTDEAYLKQRRHLNPNVFKEANKVFINSFYNDTPEEVKKTKGYIVAGIDGSKYEVPNTPKNREYFGYQKNQNSDSNQPARAITSGIYDLNNKFYLDIQLDKYLTSEIDLAKKNIEQMMKTISNQKIIVILDRGYISLEFLLWLNERNIKYLFRLGSDKFKKEVTETKTQDEFVNIKHTYPRLQNIRKRYPEEAKKLEELEQTKVRITKKNIKTKEGKNEEIRILSNLEFDEFNSEEILKLYLERWNIEESYDNMKNKLKSESFTGNLPIIIEQDLYAQMLLYNQVLDMVNESNERLKEKKKKTKLEYQININKAIGLFKDEFIKIILIEDDKKSSDAYDKLMDEMTNYVSSIRPNRPSNPRKFNNHNKYRTNMKPSY